MATCARCDNCRSWVRLDPGDLYQDEERMLLEDGQSFVGTCRRHPPTVDGTALHHLAVARMARTSHANDDHANAHLWEASRWPVTYEDDWCGDHQSVEALSANVHADWLEEHGQRQAAAMLRQAFPMDDGRGGEA